MTEFSEWFKDTFQQCYCDQGKLVDEKRFEEIVQLVLDDEADDNSRRIFEEKVKNCVKSQTTFEKEKNLREKLRQKLSEHKTEIPDNLIDSIRKSIAQ